MEKNGHYKGITAALASALFLGIAPVFGKQAILFGYSPLALVTLRTGLATLFLAVFMLLWSRKFFYIFPVGLLGCAIAGVVNGIGSIFYYTALSRLDTSVAQLLYSFYPVFLGLWLLLDRQTIQKITIIRLLIALPGTYLLISAAENKVDLVGAFFMVTAAILYALHLLINQRILYEAPAQTVTFYTLLVMTITVTAAYLIFDRTMPGLGTPFWPIVGMALITVFSRLALFMGVKRLGGLQTALIGLGELVITVALSQIWLGERLSLLQWIGAILICVNIVMIGFDKPTIEKRKSTGMLGWLNPPKISPSELPWQSHS
ncbi:MAG: DMT family transporter [Anaerolineaceae bacterium]|nr:DMT family transporter [Anaerolineaceae bacterium]